MALATLAAEGTRGLTHRAVDRAAGLPSGSTSNCFRTRAALLQAAAERLGERISADLAALRLRGDASPQGAADAVAWLVEQWTSADRERWLARFELSLEATRRPEIRKTLLAIDSHVRTTVAELLRGAGVPGADSWADGLIAYSDALFLGHLLNPRPGELGDLRPKIDALLAMVTSDARPAGP
ncbi:TetR/AcrR family transcriptional regulator [[Actinomadura] parvosata]|uniref:TetR/AcrR family transcriptional regulator n=1 Tax=[Actinomadura] parvosata TaxID=1955412 RepID=UPI00406D3C10